LKAYDILNYPSIDLL